MPANWSWVMAPVRTRSVASKASARLAVSCARFVVGAKVTTSSGMSWRAEEGALTRKVAMHDGLDETGPVGRRHLGDETLRQRLDATHRIKGHVESLRGLPRRQFAESLGDRDDVATERARDEEAGLQPGVPRDVSCGRDKREGVHRVVHEVHRRATPRLQRPTLGVEAKDVDRVWVQVRSKIVALCLVGIDDGRDDALHVVVERVVAKTNEVLINVAVGNTGQPYAPTSFVAVRCSRLHRTTHHGRAKECAELTESENVHKTYCTTSVWVNYSRSSMNEWCRDGIRVRTLT